MHSMLHFGRLPDPPLDLRAITFVIQCRSTNSWEAICIAATRHFKFPVAVNETSCLDACAPTESSTKATPRDVEARICASSSDEQRGAEAPYVVFHTYPSQDNVQVNDRRKKWPGLDQKRGKRLFFLLRVLLTSSIHKRALWIRRSRFTKEADVLIRGRRRIPGSN